MRRIAIERISASAAQEYWHACNESLIFTNPRFLQGMCSKVHWWMGTFRNNPIFFWPVCLDDCGNTIVPALAKYVGPFATDDFRVKAFYRQWSIQEDLYPAFLRRFLSEYGSIGFATRPGETDIRQFAWWSKAEGNNRHLDIQPRYTAVIREIDQHSSAELRGRLRRDRKAQLSKASKLGLRTTDAAGEAEVFELYQRFLHTKGAGDLACSRKRQVQHLVQFSRNERGKTIGFRDHSNSLVGVLILLHSRAIAHSVLAVTQDNYRHCGVTAMLEYHAIMHAQEAGKITFDFMGANSPKGAAEKHSYGAVPELYFGVESL